MSKQQLDDRFVFVFAGDVHRGSSTFVGHAHAGTMLQKQSGDGLRAILARMVQSCKSKFVSRADVGTML